MGNNLNKTRYAYFYGEKFYDFFATLVGFILIAFILIIDTLNGKIFEIPFFISLLITIPILLILPTFIMKFFYAVEKEEAKKAFYVSFTISIIFFLGIYLISSALNEFWLIFGIILILISVVSFLNIQNKMGRIKIYPDRIKMGKLEFYLKDLDLIKIIEKEITNDEISKIEKDTGKKIIKYTPIKYKFNASGFVLYYFHIWIETKDTIYLAQSVSHRNQFVQNMRNAFYEDWRWDGSSEPPEDWEMPDYRSQGLI